MGDRRRSQPQAEKPAETSGVIGRRAFLTGSGLAAASGAFAAAGGTARARANEEDSSVDPRTSSYRETEHVRRFYRSSRF